MLPPSPWLLRFLPSRASVSQAERFRAAGGALLGILVTGLVSAALVRATPTALWLIAPMGASAVLLFALPSSPLAQPWSIVGGNLVAGVVGVTCARLVGSPLLAASAAIFFAIGGMLALRCLHPPSGAVALTAVLGGADVHAAGYAFVLQPVALNSVLIVLVAMAYNNVTRRRYPHGQQVDAAQPRAVADAGPAGRLGFDAADLQAALADYDEVLDVSPDDLALLFRRTEMHAFRRRFGAARCSDVMTRDVPHVEFATELDEAWRLLHLHRAHALPVVGRFGHVVGIVTRADFLAAIDVSDRRSLPGRLAALLRRTPHTHSSKPEVVGQIMRSPVRTARADAPLVDLVPHMGQAGPRHMPVVDARDRLVGMVAQADLLAALYAACIGQIEREAEGR